MKRFFGAMALACVLGTTTLASAQNTDAVFAETLYRQGRALMEEKRYDEACQKFAESHRLDAATGTLLNLAACNEARGKMATAWLQFNDALLSARRDQRDDRVQFASERIAAIEPKLSKLTVLVKPEADVEGLEVRIDGTPIGPAARGVPSPVDPGKHTISASAPGKKPWSRDIEIGAEADSKTVEVPPLLDGPSERATGPVQSVRPKAGPSDGPDRLVTERPTPTSVYVLGATTAAFAVGFVVTGGIFLERKAQYNELNEDASATSSDRETARDSARIWGVANGVFAAGTIVGAAGTAYLYFTRPEVKTRATTVTPWVGSQSAGISVQGALF